LRVVILVQGETELTEVVQTLGADGSGTDPLHGREQQREQDANDRHDDQQFEQGHCPAVVGGTGTHGMLLEANEPRQGRAMI
jgi:hypothetical protein